MNVDSGRRQFLLNGGLGLVSAGTGLSKIDTEETCEIVEQNLGIRDLPADFEGFRAAMISDIHSGPYMSKQIMDRYVEQLNRLRPDIIFLLGDFVDHRVEEVEPACEALRRLQAPYGVFGCLGNHDYYADAEIVARELSHANIRMMRNEHLTIEKGNSRIALIGIDDVRNGHPFDQLFSEAVQGLSPSIPSILLMRPPGASGPCSAGTRMVARLCWRASSTSSSRLHPSCRHTSRGCTHSMRQTSTSPEALARSVYPCASIARPKSRCSDW